MDDPTPSILVPPSLFQLFILCFLLLIVLKLFSQHRRDARALLKKLAPLPKRVSFLVMGLFLVMVGWVTYWQFAGHLHPGLARFQKLYDTRPETKNRKWVRGRILDRHGSILATNTVHGQRAYPLGPAAAHIVGYASPKYGTLGLEGALDAELMGRTWHSPQERQRITDNILHRNIIVGHDVTTTLDADLQRMAYELLVGKRGALVITEVDTGRILVAASSPSFDPQEVLRHGFGTLYQREDAPVLFRPFQGRYPPGSVFKCIVTCVALEKKKHWVFDCPGEGFSPTGQGWWVRDHEYYEYRNRGAIWPGYGRITLATALIKSSNVFFGKLGIALGMDILYQGAVRFGFNLNFNCFADTGRSGGLEVYRSPFPEDMGRNASDTARVSIGQSRVEMTPLHLALVKIGRASCRAGV